MNETNLKYFLYARKSSESEDRQIASIQSQIDELKHLSEKNGLNIVSILREEKSAKAPGRPIFNQMIDAINSGNANGILCWKLDRLARNPIDGGTINWMLQQGKIKHIQTFQRGYLPEDNTLMMSLEFGMANQFVLDLSVNTKRGMRNKAEQGWLPHKPPIGYLNNKHNLPEHPPIYKNPEMFPLIKKLWDTLLKERCSIDALYEKAIEMDLKTTKQTIIKRSAFYDIFRNPFYYGSFIWNGKLHIGKHEPMISKEDFDLAQMIIDGKVHKIKKNHTFLYTNLIRCADCGASITAEKKVKHQKNGNIHKYTYYRCTRRIDINCKQKAIREKELEKQIHTVLEKIEIPASFHQWAIKYLKQEHEKEKSGRNEIIELYQKSLNRCTSKLDNLIDMRINQDISTSEFNKKKLELQNEKAKYEELLADSSNRVDTWIEKAESLFSLAETAKKRFEEGSFEEKRQILSSLGSNLLLKDKKLIISDNKNVLILKNLAPEVRGLHSRLEPPQSQLNQEFWEEKYAQSVKWGA